MLKETKQITSIWLCEKSSENQEDGNKSFFTDLQCICINIIYHKYLEHPFPVSKFRFLQIDELILDFQEMTVNKDLFIGKLLKLDTHIRKRDQTSDRLAANIPSTR